METKQPKIKCPVCKSTNNILEGTLFQCNNCGYCNVNFNNIPKTRKIMSLREIAVSEDITSMNSLYVKLLTSFIQLKNKYNDKIDAEQRIIFDKFCNDFENVLKGLFEEIEELKKQ